MITRYLNINEELAPGKVLVIYGPRRVGKTTLLNDYIEKSKAKLLQFQGDSLRDQEQLSKYDKEHLRRVVRAAA